LAPEKRKGDLVHFALKRWSWQLFVFFPFGLFVAKCVFPYLGLLSFSFGKRKDFLSIYFLGPFSISPVPLRLPPPHTGDPSPHNTGPKIKKRLPRTARWYPLSVRANRSGFYKGSEKPGWNPVWCEPDWGGGREGARGPERNG